MENQTAAVKQRRFFSVIRDEHFSDAEVRFRYHKCLVKEKKFEEALDLLVISFRYTEIILKVMS
ncbi:hypothetical protein KIN20_037740 [Parelaphostrongylus tenuis]|uniref:Uncharacterized protein n=1 Tax=Parelaphostrongylus tenuis TaxID=148309 RepID=A0AAD5REP0_PARTN|nr:hypothetical protein KIN20_037740 [Parelaphostrongylus tenuis]